MCVMYIQLQMPQQVYKDSHSRKPTSTHLLLCARSQAHAHKHTPAVKGKGEWRDSSAVNTAALEKNLGSIPST